MNTEQGPCQWHSLVAHLLHGGEAQLLQPHPELQQLRADVLAAVMVAAPARLERAVREVCALTVSQPRDSRPPGSRWPDEACPPPYPGPGGGALEYEHWAEEYFRLQLNVVMPREWWVQLLS